MNKIKIYCCFLSELGMRIIKVEHLPKKRKKRTVKPTDEKKYVCTLCNESFKTMRNLRRHRLIHSGHKPFHCDICNRRFSRRDNLSSHKRRTHDRYIRQ